MKTPYIKPTRYKHSSGYRTFEVGYCDIDSKNNAVDIEVLGNGADHIFQDYMMLVGGEPFCLNMDLTVNGYIRFFVFDQPEWELDWDYHGFASSDMGLKLVKKEPSEKSNHSN